MKGYNEVLEEMPRTKDNGLQHLTNTDIESSYDRSFHIMKTALVKGSFQFELREETVREIKIDEVLIKVKACGIIPVDLLLLGRAPVYTLE